MVLRSSSVGALVAAVWVSATAPESIDYAAIYSNNEQAMVFVSADGHLYNDTTERMTGSGFFVSDDGLVLTNNHVTFANKENYREIVVNVHVKSRTSPPVRALIEWTDPVNDLALLRVVPSAAIRRVALGKSGDMKVGQLLAVMGFPLTSDLSIVNGLISNKSIANRWQTNTAVNFGNSGGPVFNAAGEVIGVVASGTVGATIPGVGEVDVDGINYFIPIDVLEPSETEPVQHHGRVSVAKALELARVKPTPVAKVRQLARTFAVSQVKDDHPSLLPHTRGYSQTFQAEPGYKIVNARVEQLSANFVTDLGTAISPDGSQVTLTYTLRSGPLFDRYRAWLHANVHTEQVQSPADVRVQERP